MARAPGTGSLRIPDPAISALPPVQVVHVLGNTTQGFRLLFNFEYWDFQSTVVDEFKFTLEKFYSEFYY